ncbi:MAG TPA: three-Cys-motif partner protein TcmP [Terriglobales bacterium]|nr:three-Cys-motif partner protein TcmP [Terriglobales bacterium]
MEVSLPEPIEDGLPTPEVGPWAEDKYRIVSMYSGMFATGMKKKWHARVYIDLYSGAGQVRVKSTPRLLFGSPLLALQVRDPFDKYVFCEEDPTLLKALEARSKRIAPQAATSFIPGSCDERVKDIVAAIPLPSKNQTVLSLCFVDPFHLGLHFQTLETLAARFTDFLVLLCFVYGCEQEL